MNRRRRDFAVANSLATEPDRTPTDPSCSSAGVCYTYDDVIFHPGHIDFPATDVSAGTRPPPLRRPDEPRRTFLNHSRRPSLVPRA